MLIMWCFRWGPLWGGVGGEGVWMSPARISNRQGCALTAPGCLRRLTFSFGRVRKNSRLSGRALSLLVQCLVKQAKNLRYWCWFVNSEFTKLHRKCFLYGTNGRASMFKGVLPTLSLGSSRFPKWQRQKRRPWHTAEIMWLICPQRVEIYSKWQPR